MMPMDNITAITATLIILIASLKFTRFVLERYVTNGKDRVKCMETCPLIEKISKEKRLDHIESTMTTKFNKLIEQTTIILDNQKKIISEQERLIKEWFER